MGRISLFEILEFGDYGYQGGRQGSGVEPVVGARHVQHDGTLAYDDVNRRDLSGVPIEKRQSRKLQPGDILVELFMHHQPSNCVGMIRHLSEDCWHSVNTIRLRVKEDLCDPNYLYFLLLRLFMDGRAQSYYSGATVLRLQARQFLQMQVSLPPLTEQKEAVARLLTVENMISRVWLLDEQTERVLASRFDDLMESSRQKNLSRSMSLGECVNVDWVSVQSVVKDHNRVLLVNGSDLQYGLRLLADQQVEYPETTQHVRLGFTEDHVLFSPYHLKSKRVAYPARAGMCIGSIIPMRSKGNSLWPSVLYFFLRSEEFIAYAQSGTSMGKMNREVIPFLLGGRIEVPPLEQQIKFHQHWEQWHQIRRKLAQQLQSLQELLIIQLNSVFHND